jgi:hypothetical protein
MKAVGITRYARTEAFTTPTEVKLSSGSRGDGYFSTASTDDEVGSQDASGCRLRIDLDVSPWCRRVDVDHWRWHDMRKSVAATQNTKHTYHMLLKTDQLNN